MSNFKRILSLVLVCAMLMSSVACLGGVFTIGAAAEDAAPTYGLYNGGKILTPAEIKTKYATEIGASDFGWAYYTSDVLEVPTDGSVAADEVVYAADDEIATYLTDGYVAAGQTLIVRNYLACSDNIYMNIPPIGFSIDKSLFTATTVDEPLLTQNDTLASKGVCMNLDHSMYDEHGANWQYTLNMGLDWSTRANQTKTGLEMARTATYWICLFTCSFDGWWQSDGQDWIGAHAIKVLDTAAEGDTGSIWVDRGANRAVDGATSTGDWFKTTAKASAPWNIPARAASDIEGGNTADAGTADYMHKTGLVVITSDFGGDFIVGEPKAATHSVTFYADAEGTTALETATDYSAINEGATFDIPAETPEAPEGTTFGGWAATAGSDVTVSWPQTMGTSNMAFYPIFSARTSYSITYYADEEGTAPFSNSSAFEGDTYTILTNGPTKTGHEFAGWTATIGSTETVSGTATATANVSYYPVFTKNSYLVTFNANGGTFAENAVTSKSVPYDDAITADGISSPSKTGANFLGWAKDATATAKEDDLGTVPANNRTIIYAVWEDATYNISVYNAKGDTEPVTVFTVKYNDNNPTFDLNLLTPPEGDDGDAATTIFAGWKYVADDSDTGSKLPGRPLGTGKYTNTADTAVYATWTDSASLRFMIPDLSDNEGWVDVYTHVKLRNGGGNNTYDESTFTAALEAANAKAAENGLSYTTNLDWYSDAELTTIAANQKGQTPEGELYTYADTGVTYLYISESYKAVANLYANEGDETPFITKEGQAGKNSDERQHTFVISKDALPEAPVGQHFVGWFDKEGNELAPTAESAKAYTYTLVAGSNDYFAKFEDIVFTVEFKIEGTVVGTAEATYGDTINFAEVAAASNGTIPAIGDSVDALYKPGYNFKGWSEAYSPNELLTDTFVVDNSKKIVANAIDSGTHTITFYANANGGNFEARKYVATFVCPEGAAFADGETTKTLDVAVGTTRENISRALVNNGTGLPTMEGHTFVYWSYDTAIGGTSGDMPAQDFTYTAVFTANPLKVTFDLNNGSEEIISINKTYGDSAAATLAEFSHPYNRWPAGTVFEGWELVEGTLGGADGDTFTGDVTYKAKYATYGEKYLFIVYNSGCETNDTAEKSTYNEYIYKTIEKGTFKTQYWNKGEYVESKEDTEILLLEDNVIIFYNIKLMGFDFERFFEIEMWQNLYFTVVPVDVAKSMFTIDGMINTIKLIITALGAL